MSSSWVDDLLAALKAEPGVIEATADHDNKLVRVKTVMRDMHLDRRLQQLLVEHSDDPTWRLQTRPLKLGAA